MDKRVTRSKSLRSSTNPFLEKNEEEDNSSSTTSSTTTLNSTKTTTTQPPANSKIVKNEIKTEILVPTESTNDEESKANVRRTRSTRLSISVGGAASSSSSNANMTKTIKPHVNEITDNEAAISTTPSNALSIIKTRSYNRLGSTNSMLNSSLSNDQFITTNNNETRKRHLSQTDINDSLHNDDSNSNGSSIISSTTASNALTTILNHTNTENTMNNNPKKQKLLSNQQQQINKFFSSPTKVTDGEIVINKNCLVNTCDSSGHLNGRIVKHRLVETCPVYYGLSTNEAESRRKQLDKSLSEINKKISTNAIATTNSNNTPEKRVPRHSISASQKLHQTSEQAEYFKKVEKLRITDFNNYSNNESLNNSDNNNNNTTINETINDSSILNGTLTASKTINPPSISDLNVPQFDIEIFRDALMLNADSIVDDCGSEDILQKQTQQNQKLIQFGDFEIETWYKSPYPDEYWQLNKIFICEFCLKYMKTKGILSRHIEKCIWRHPPGNEIYRRENLSFFEVDGKFNKIYCQNLCLLAKLFLDHKTLYFDVEPFLFYVLTSYDQANGKFNIIGYFSKEKQSILNFNLSCILILPPYMNKGYGKLLIDFSYLLSKIEEKIGSPERPLSDLGLVSYRSYWKAKLLAYLSSYLKNDEISIKDMSHDTGIHPNDIISTFQYIGLVKYWKGKHVLLKDKDLISKYLAKQNTFQNKNLNVDETCIKWTPYIDPSIPVPATNHHHHHHHA